MDSNGKLNIQLNRRDKKQRNSFLPEESEPSNQFFNSHFSQNQSELSNNNANNYSPNPNRREISKQKSKELKQTIEQPPGNRNNNRHNPNLKVIKENQASQNENKQEKKRPKLNSFEPQHQKPEQKVAGEVKKKKQEVKQIYNPSPKIIKQAQQPVIKEQPQVNISKNIELLNSSLNDIRDNYQEIVKQQQQFSQRKSSKKQRQLQPFGVKLSISRQKQIKQFLTIKQKEAKMRRKMLNDIRMKQQHKMQLQIKEQEMLKERDRKRRLKELKQYSRFQDKHQEMREAEEEKQREAEEFIKKYQNQQKYHTIQELQDKQRQKKRQFEERKILQQRKDMFKQVDQTQIEEHQKWHQDKLYELMREKQDAKQEEAQRIFQQNSNMNDLFRGQSHGFVQQEIMEKRRKKRQPKQKAKRIRQYKQYIKNNFKPKTYQPRTLEPRETQNDSRQSHRQVKKYRYYKGVAYGAVTESIPQAKNHAQQKKIGDNYMQFMKSLPKKRQQSQQSQLLLDPEEIKILQRKFNSIGRVKKESSSIYDENRRKKSIEIPKNVKRDQLKMIVLQLQANDQKLKKKQVLLNYQQHGKIHNVQGEQKVINQGFVQNIEKKLSLLAQL